MKHRTLSKTYSAFIGQLIETDKDCLTIQEAYRMSSSSKNAVKKMLSEMIRKGWLLRLKEGIYYRIPQERDPDNFIPNWHVTASCLARDREFYIAYYSALEIHSLITQPALREMVVVNRQIKPSLIKIQGVEFQFICHNDKHFFGFTRTKIDKYNRVVCSDLEKTIIDCLYKPEYANGIVEVAKAIYKVMDMINYDKLMSYMRRFDSHAVIKRFGFLVNLLEIDTPITDELLEMRSSAYTPLDPSMPKEGKMVSKWRILVNEDLETIIQAPHT